VANTNVNIITQWPGARREEVEQQVTIPIEIVMNGIRIDQSALQVRVRLSSVTLIFDDDSINDWNRQKALERLSQGYAADNIQAQMGPTGVPSDRSTVHTDQHESEIRVME